VPCRAAAQASHSSLKSRCLPGNVKKSLTFFHSVVMLPRSFEHRCA
jgi:hypothetical protein